MLAYFFNRPLAPPLQGLADLALDLRWTWSHFSDRLWETLDRDGWERTGNPYFILQNVSQARLDEAANDPSFTAELQKWITERQRYLQDSGWYGQQAGAATLKSVAYFSMEFGLGEALPVYSGGLGILAGDHLKTASDLGVPMVGVGLLYQQGYFRQVLDPDGRQQEAFPYNDPTSLPVTPVQNREGGWLRIRLELPGRSILVRVWQALVGKVTLYLLDSNDLLNSPADRGATALLYPSSAKARLTQEIILGLAGWRVLEELGLEVDVCHLNEGHAAFAVLARAHSYVRRTGQPFHVALWATRAGNTFTTHTPVEAAFDRFPPELIRPYVSYLAELMQVSIRELLALGRKDPDDDDEPFNMAYLALRGCSVVNGVSRLHETVSREIFQPLFPHWPQYEVPIGHVTNGVHVPSWDSQQADTLWTCTCGKERWLGRLDELCASMERVSDEDLWSLRTSQRQALIRYARHRLIRQMRERGAAPEHIQQARHILDANAITLGFARRFTEYKRPNLLLHDADRLARILSHSQRPVQLIVAGKAHPNDAEGKQLIHAFTSFAGRSDIWNRVVFLEDYDMALAQHLVAGIDVWINTPRRPMEACGTSGMKILVNGGLNLSELDGWWAEAYQPDVGWAIGDNQEHYGLTYNGIEASRLYSILEQEVIPEFYERDRRGMPQKWLKRIRTSMARLTPQFSSNRMVREYVERIYLPASAALRRRSDNHAKLARDLEAWHSQLRESWGSVRFGDMRMIQIEDRWHVETEVYVGELKSDHVEVQLYADPLGDAKVPTCVAMSQQDAIPGAVNGFIYTAECSASRPADHYTPRIVPFHPDALIPLEEPLIVWKR
jgi:starch phosphorylase